MCTMYQYTLELYQMMYKIHVILFELQFVYITHQTV
jgi:hypothetical protein